MMSGILTLDIRFSDEKEGQKMEEVRVITRDEPKLGGWAPAGESGPGSSALPHPPTPVRAN